jgi:hypothetical protein
MMYEYDFNLCVTVNVKGKLLVIDSNTETENALEIYIKRWRPQTMFGFFDTKKFNFENPHITDMNKIGKMVIIISVS